MYKKPLTKRDRYPKGVMASYIINYTFIRNPYITMWWSAALPGFGHVFLCKYFQGSLLIIWELVINLKSNLNTAIMYSLTGEFDLAKQALDSRWFLFYIAVYIYAIWDSRNTTIELNKFSILSDREGSTIIPFEIKPLDINYLEIRKPWMAIIWSILFPGLGQLYVNRLATGFYVIIWWIITSYYSHFLEAVQLSFTGHFDQATSVLKSEWFLFLPSMYGFAIYDAYINSIEYNRLFRREQAKYLKKRFQNPEFKLPFFDSPKSGEDMYVVASFEHSVYLELAITDLNENGFSNENIFTVPLVKKEDPKDTLHVIKSNGFSLMDGALVLGTAFMVIGAIYGFVLTWGPIIWGLIGLLVGSALGFSINLFFHKKKRLHGKMGGKGAEVFVLIQCHATEAEKVERILWNHFTLGIAKIC